MRYILRNIIIVILIGIIGYQYYVYSRYTPGETIVVDGDEFEVIDRQIDTAYVEVFIEVEKYTPIYITRVDTVEIILPMNTDTLSILGDYFLSYTYIDTLKLEGLGSGYVTDVVTQNRIDTRSVIWDYTIPTRTQTIITKPVPKNDLYIGPTTRMIGGDFISSLGASVLLKSKRDYIYQVETGVGTNSGGKIRPYLGFGYYWKITN